MINILPSDIFTVRGEIVAGGRVYVAAANQEQDVPGPRAGGSGDDVSATPGHVPRRAVPLLPTVRLKVLQVERISVVDQQ